ncbi:alkaline phosphatase family protein [Proteobacteria bacterium 005FR1]|nr:alkaline phosphatase family protein [Proteobacteria bacterium 005FR1]
MLAGPVLRRVERRRLVLWLVASRAQSWRLRLLASDGGVLFDRLLREEEEAWELPLGARAFLYLINVAFSDPLPSDEVIEYDLGINAAGDQSPSWIRDWAPHLCMAGEQRPNFVIKSRIDRLYHGSCRRPHHSTEDGLVRLDAELRKAGKDPGARAALMMMSGDQVYADDVAGPMLRAIHALIESLGLFEEKLEGSVAVDSRALREHPQTYYHRDKLLPKTESNEALVERFIGGARKPVFTTANAQNHLISLNEMLAIYLLVWSPLCWAFIRPTDPVLGDEEGQRYTNETKNLNAFVATLPRAARAMAHIPNYMIFDDHDITDDWNLSALWEATAYEHPLSRRIVGNALIAYLLCQAWGNAPSRYRTLVTRAERMLRRGEENGLLPARRQSVLIERLFRFNSWNYSLDTSPMLVVLDTRTRRWRSEISRGRPSGLMDWEALTEFQQNIMGQQSVVVVSAAPMFGVKLIEVIQRVFTFFGRPLLVDAENWMAHRGAASVLFNIFAHSGTPKNFTILSGDVHYSFAYDVRLRRRPDNPRIWQITSSGIKNEFPPVLLEWLDRINRWIYAPWSPLNWFTKRRAMRVSPRLPTGRSAGERLWNAAGIGEVIFDEQGAPREIRQLNATEGGTRFLARQDLEE